MKRIILILVLATSQLFAGFPIYQMVDINEVTVLSCNLSDECDLSLDLNLTKMPTTTEVVRLKISETIAVQNLKFESMFANVAKSYRLALINPKHNIMKFNKLSYFGKELKKLEEDEESSIEDYEKFYKQLNK